MTYPDSIPAGRTDRSGSAQVVIRSVLPELAEVLDSSIEIINPLLGDAWDSALKEASTMPTVFHTSAWAHVLHDTYGHDPHYLCVRRGGRILAFVPLMEVSSGITGRRAVGIPFADTCAPLWVSEPDHAMLADVLAFYARSYHWKHLEIRGGLDLKGAAITGQSYQTHEVDLAGGTTSLWSRLNPAARRAIRKAEQAGLKVSVDQSESSIRDYYQLHSRTRRRFGLPPQPLDFFLNVHQQFIRRQAGVTVIASGQQGPVAGAVFLIAGDQAIYKFGASDERFWSVRPNQLVMWRGMIDLERRGIHTLGLGRTAVGNTGLARFKSAFAAKAGLLIYRRYRPDHGWRGDPGITPSEKRRLLFRSTPIFLNRLAGACIYPHLD